jgi:hypothetical protein
MKRLLAVAGLALAVGASPASAQEPTQHQRRVWDRACVAAGGEVSPQIALVCVHFGFPTWSEDRPGGLTLLRNVCENALGGEFVRRSEFPTELAACFFEA